ncbi:MAG TPA: archease [Bellilinea sp.]|nr:archease [Bellilinea sp.]
MRSGFEEIQHTADWALKVWAPDFSSLLEQAARGMNHLMGVVIDPSQPAEIEFSLTAGDQESLLVGVLNRILYALEMDSIGVDSFDLFVAGFQVQARLKGGRVVELQKMIKAVTYHNLAIRSSESGLETTIVFDV